MPLVEVGRVCVKKYGRDARSRAVVTKVIDGNFVEVITAERPKARKCNIKHLEFLHENVEVKDKAAIAKALEIEVSKMK